MAITLHPIHFYFFHRKANNHYLWFLYFFCKIQYKHRHSQTHVQSPLWIYAHNSTLTSTPKRLSRQNFKIDEVTTDATLSTSTSPTTERIKPVKFYRKMRAPVTSRSLVIVTKVRQPREPTRYSPSHVFRPIVLYETWFWILLFSTTLAILGP